MPISQSSHLQSYSYDEDTQTLTVEFQNGSIYQYGGVPQTVYDTFKQQGGSGTYFWTKIRNQYRTSLVFKP